MRTARELYLKLVEVVAKEGATHTPEFFSGSARAFAITVAHRSHVLIEFIRVGGATKNRAAVEEGVLPGRQHCPLAYHPLAGQFINDDQKTGIDIVRRALVTPGRLGCSPGGVCLP